MLSRCVVLGSVLLGAMVVEGKIVATASGPSSASLSQGKFEVPGGPGSNAAWGDLADARFVDLPAHLSGVTSMVPGHRLKESTKISLACVQDPNDPPIEMCDMFTFLFRCPPCEAEHGGLIQQLLADGWSLSHCGMKFKTGVMGGASHKMITLRKQVAAGEKAEYTTPNAVIDYIAFGGSDYGVKCEDHLMEGPCEGAVAGNGATGMCSWNTANGKCSHNDFCPKPTGPHFGGQGGHPVGGPGCQVCPHDELPAGHHMVHPIAPSP